MEVIVTAIYWVFLFEGFVDALTLFRDLNGHLFPIIALFLDFIFNPFDFYIKRYLITLIVGVIYTIINLVYTLGHQPIYQILKWKDWLSYVIALGSYLSSLIIFGLGILVYHCCCKEKLLMRKIKENPETIFERDL